MGRLARNSDPAADYSSGAKHVLDVIHEILARHRTLEQKWTSKKVKLHQRLALKLFKEDVKQVCSISNLLNSKLFKIANAWINQAPHMGCAILRLCM